MVSWGRGWWGSDLLGAARWGILNNKYLFFTVLEAGKSKIKMPAGVMSGENSLLVHKVFFWKIFIWRPVLPVFLRAQSASFLISTLNSFQSVLKVSGQRLHPCRGRWQVTIFNWQIFDGRDWWILLDLRFSLRESFRLWAYSCNRNRTIWSLFLDLVSWAFLRVHFI